MTQLAKQPKPSEIVEEYHNKLVEIEEVFEKYQSTLSEIQLSTKMRGTYVHGNFPNQYSLNLDAMKDSLLRSSWKYIYDGFNISKIASASERSRHEKFLENPPEFNLENIRELVGSYYLDPRGHVLRGLAESFCRLSDTYKSHTKVKIGVKGLPKKVIINNFVTEWGGRGYGQEYFTDMIRAYHAYLGEKWDMSWSTLDGIRKKSILSYDDIELPEGVSKQDISFKMFQNGNLHVIFGPDSLRNINLALNEYYGDVLPDVDPEIKTSKGHTSTAVSKDLQYYPTPKKVIDALLRDVHLSNEKMYLEPSCGCGRILDNLPKNSIGVEYEYERVLASRAKGHKVIHGNFLEQEPEEIYDYVVMNPPFYGRHYVKHIEHAKKFLKKGGMLVSVLPATAYYDHKELEFKGHNAWSDLPVGSFSESGTNVPTGIHSWVKK